MRNVGYVYLRQVTPAVMLLQVSTAEGQALAEQYNCPFFESSAARRQGVDEVFHQIIRQVRKTEQVRYHELTKKHKNGGFRQCLKQIRNWAKSPRHAKTWGNRSKTEYLFIYLGTKSEPSEQQFAPDEVHKQSPNRQVDNCMYEPVVCFEGAHPN